MARLGDILVGMGLATEEQRAQAFLLHRREGGRFGTALLEAGVPEAAVATGLGTQHNVPPATSTELEEIRQEVLRLVPLRTAQRLGVVPFRREGRLLSVAMKDPHDLRSLDDISLATGLEVRAFAALEARIDTALAKHYGARVVPRHVSAIRLGHLRKATEGGSSPPAEQSTAPRKARPTTLRVVYPPSYGGRGPEPDAALAPLSIRTAASTRDRSDPWNSTEARLAAAVLRPPDSEITEDDFRLSASIPPPRVDLPAPASPPDLVPDGPEPTVEERLADDLGEARSNDDVIDAVLAAAGNYVRRAALFVVEGEYVVGWGARPEPEEDLREFRLSLTEASVFATLRDTEGFYVGTYMDLPSTVKVLRALGSDGLGTMAVVPVTLKGKTVLYIWGESESYTRPPSVPALKRLAAMLATGLEIVRLKSRLFSL
ncbi:MAG TPA: hypothetical protein VL084_06310 [Thermoanaerobaculia bacterium]|nr:hypothetical protein [Thermoanaerobaculia bacterium]